MFAAFSLTFDIFNVSGNWIRQDIMLFASGGRRKLLPKHFPDVPPMLSQIPIFLRPFALPCTTIRKGLHERNWGRLGKFPLQFRTRATASEVLNQLQWWEERRGEEGKSREGGWVRAGDDTSGGEGGGGARGEVKVALNSIISWEPESLRRQLSDLIS